MIPSVLKNFLHSEKAVASGLLVIVASVLVFTGRITAQEWMDYTRWVLGIYVAGKAAQGTASVIAKNKQPDVNDLASKLTEKLLANDEEADAQAK